MRPEPVKAKRQIPSRLRRSRTAAGGWKGIRREGARDGWFRATRGEPKGKHTGACPLFSLGFSPSVSLTINMLYVKNKKTYREELSEVSLILHEQYPDITFNSQEMRDVFRSTEPDLAIFVPSQLLSFPIYVFLRS